MKLRGCIAAKLSPFEVKKQGGGYKNSFGNVNQFKVIVSVAERKKIQSRQVERATSVIIVSGEIVKYKIL